MTERRLQGATLTLKLKTEAFDIRTRDSSTGRLVGSAAELLARALPALERELRQERGNPHPNLTLFLALA